VIRIAAVGDVHYDRSSRDRLRSGFEALAGKADLLLIAGDLTQHGTVEEAQALAGDLKGLSVPVISVLGNHDFHSGQERQIADMLREHGVTVLEGEGTELRVREHTVGVMGLKGFGGGFAGACVTEFGEKEMKAFAHHGRVQADILRRGLEALDTDYRFALLHFAPIEGTLLGEKKEIFPFLGSYLLGEAIDAAQCDGAFHGHAHHGLEKGSTPGGVPVRNVAQMVIRHAYNIYSFETPRRARLREANAAALADVVSTGARERAGGGLTRPEAPIAREMSAGPLLSEQG
jgi:Icc-related predicted phosphoesterase